MASVSSPPHRAGPFPPVDEPSLITALPAAAHVLPGLLGLLASARPLPVRFASILAEPVAREVSILLKLDVPARGTNLRPAMAALLVEGGRAPLDASLLVGLCAVDLARSFLRGIIPAPLSGGAGLRDQVERIGRAMAAVRPEAFASVGAELGAGLALAMVQAGQDGASLAARARGVDLVAELVGEGHLLSWHPEDSPEAMLVRLCAALGRDPADPALRWLEGPGPRRVTPGDRVQASLARLLVGQALLDRVRLVEPGPDGSLVDGELRPVQSAGACLAVPRGGRPYDAFVVAVRLDALVDALGKGPDPHAEATLLGTAWSRLVADAPAGLHQRVGPLGISAFVDGMEALAFAERATRTLSGPRVFDAGQVVVPCQVGPEIKVAAGLAYGPVRGGTDGEQVALEGPAVAWAMQLAQGRPRGLGGLSALGRESGGGVHVHAGAATALLEAAARAGRALIEAGSLGVEPGLRLPCMGGWHAVDRRILLLGEESAALVSLDGSLNGAPVEEDTGSLARVVPPPPSEVLRSLDLRASQVSARELLATDALLQVGAPERPSAPTPDWQPLEPLEEEAPVAPAWDATGFSLPEFSHEGAEDEPSADVDHTEEPFSYSLEVDDDYGFEEEAPVVAPTLTGVAPPVRRAGASRLGPAELEIFALTELSASATAAGRLTRGPRPSRPGPASWPLAPPARATRDEGPSQTFGVVQSDSLDIDDDDDALDLAEEPVPSRPPGAAMLSAPSAELPHPRRAPAPIPARELANLFQGYVVFADGSGAFTFGLRDGAVVRDAHCYETLGDKEAAYRAFLQAKVAEGLVPRLEVWSPLPNDARPEAIEAGLLQRAYQAMVTS